MNSEAEHLGGRVKLVGKLMSRGFSRRQSLLVVTVILDSHLPFSLVRRGQSHSIPLKGRRMVMNRKLILVAAATTLISLSPAQQDRAGNPQMSMQPSISANEIHRQAAIQMNELAGHIRSLSDSRRFVDMIAKMFADDLAPKWASRSIRDRVAHAEYESATDQIGRAHV